MRKNSEQVCSQEVIDIIFPSDLSGVNLKQLESNIQTFSQLQAQNQELKEIAYSEEFTEKLEGMILKCPNPLVSKLFEEYVEKNELEIHESRLSRFFSNSQIEAKFLEVKKNFSQLETVFPDQSTRIRELLNSIFDTYESIPSLEKLLLHFPGELQKIYNMRELLMESQTMELSSSVSYYIAICASAEVGSEYMVTRLIKEFFRAGGQAAWLDKNTCPDKMKAIVKLSNMMAYRPWEIDEEFIEEIKPWSKDEILHASSIISFYQMLSQICLIFGLNPENSLKIAQKFIHETNVSLEPFPSTNKMSQSMMEVINNEFDSDGRKSDSGRSSNTTVDDEELKNEITEYMKTADKKIVENSLFLLLRKKFENFVEKTENIELRNEDTYPSIEESEWNFQQHLHPMVSNYSPELGKQLNLILTEIKTSNEAELPMIKRKSIRYYADSYMGYVHDGFNYEVQMKKMLSLKLRFFVMIAIQYPFLLTQEIVCGILEEEEVKSPGCMSKLLYISLLVSKTKMEKGLVYVTKALNDMDEL